MRMRILGLRAAAETHFNSRHFKRYASLRTTQQACFQYGVHPRCGPYYPNKDFDPSLELLSRPGSYEPVLAARAHRVGLHAGVVAWDAQMRRLRVNAQA